MAKYIIKHNLPVNYQEPIKEYNSHRDARRAFLSMSMVLADRWYINVLYREKPLRRTIRVEIDGFYYYVELYKEQ